MANSRSARDRRLRTPYGWLGAGAVGVGVWAALAAGAGVAHAEGPATDSASTESVSRGVSATANSGVARRPSRAAAHRVARQNPVASVGASDSDRPAAVANRVRRDLGGVRRGASPVATISDRSMPANPPVGAVVASAGAAATANPIADFVRLFVGSGTAENPNAGVLIGNGYSYMAYGGACTTGACNGGTAGLIGNGGDGFAGGHGGSAGWFGSGGKGGDATAVSGTGGRGGAGGLFVGDGGQGGSGGPGSGTGGDGGNAGALSFVGTGGLGGVGGVGIDGSPAGKSGFNGTPAGPNAPSLARPARIALDLFLNGGALLGLQSGYVAMFARDGEVVHATTAGYADIASRAPMQFDTQFRIASMTKPITAVAAMILVEEGRLGLDDPVAQYIPAAADLRVATSQTALPDGTFPSVPLDEPLTVRDLLKFASGIGGIATTSDLDRLWFGNNLYIGSGTLEQRVDRILTSPLYEQPGEVWRYGWSADVLARVVEVAADEPFGDFVTGRIIDPLGMTSTEFLTAESPRDRLATMYTQDSAGRLVVVDQLGGDSLDWTPGGSGLISTASDYMRFALMLWNGGTYQDTQILKPETVTLMTRPAVESGVLIDEGIEGLGWGLGMAVVVDGDATANFDRTGDYWWSGFYGTTFFVSPSTGLVGVVLSQNQPGPYSPTPYVVYLAQALAFFGL